ncbi:hypothetical protein D3C72_1055550 [compost metagenome]
MAVHHRLVVHLQLTIVNRMAQVGFEVRTGIDLCLHLRIEEPLGIAPGRFGLVHGHVRALEQFFSTVHIVVAKHRHANAGRAVVGNTVEAEGLVETADQVFHHATHMVLGLLAHTAQVLHQHHKLVTAKARHHVTAANTGDQALAYFAQQAIPLLVAQRVIQILEIIQIDEQQRRIAGAQLAGADRPFQPIHQHAPVGQAREHVKELKPLDFLARMAALGQVAANAQQASDFAGRRANGRLGNLKTPLVAAIGKAQGFFVHHRR